MSSVRIDPAATDGFAASLSDAGTRFRSTLAGLAAQVAVLPPDATAAAGAGATLAECEAAAERFAQDADRLSDILSIAAALARRADHAGGSVEDGVLVHQVLALGGRPPDMLPAATRWLCAATDAVGWVSWPDARVPSDPLDPEDPDDLDATLPALGGTLANGAESVVAGLMGRGGPAAPILGGVASMGQLLCADVGYRGRRIAPEPTAPEEGPKSADASWRDPAGKDGHEDRHGNPAGSTGTQMPDRFMGASP